MINISFKSEDEKNSIIQTYLKNGYFLKEIQYLSTGNNLIFDISTDVMQRVSELETAVNTILLGGM